MAQESSANSAVSYKDTLNLPQTDFPIRPNHKIDDQEMLQRWQKENLAAAAMVQNTGAEKFILHDGPPYANGMIHLGHAYNKILKDILTKSQRMEGKHVPVIPGWDCHGLPIEHKVTTEQPGLYGAELIAACRAFAAKWVDVQRCEFEQLGVLMDWQHPYLTMSASYEAKIMEAFAEFVSQGLITKKNKTVPWCPSCATVLAAAEIEYEERKDPSIYVLFELVDRDLFLGLEAKPANLLVWTTTPWTLPLNRAVVLKPDANYVVLQDGDTNFIVAEQLADQICAQKGIEKRIVGRVNSGQLVGRMVRHPLVENLQVPILTDGSVSLEDGTACVHSAPGCGPEDYEIGIKHNLEIYSPLSPDGKYTAAILPTALIGMPVSEGQIWVMRALAEKGRLYYKTSLRHSYPHCWRCQGGLIFRATSQWFCDLAQGGLKERALAALNQIEFVPARSKNSLEGAISGRLEWCLSRQRVWGVPIVAALCSQCGWSYTSPELIRKVAQSVAQVGIEYWQQVNLKELISNNLKCADCGGTEFVKEQDILDVWFDSGVSHYAVLYQDAQQSYPADVYLEGRDQARGWFQSSLLTSMIIEKKPPMKMIGTHGFTVDAHGRKMSKSLGNVVLPQDLVADMGLDALRLWVASNDFASDPIVSPELLNNVREVYRKIRNTLRFLLSNLYDFDSKDLLVASQLRLIDQYALFRLQQVSEKVRSNYSAGKFTSVFHILADYCTTDLSAVYLDIIKDRLYVAAKDGVERRAAQTVCFYILDSLNRLIAPIMSVTAEQIARHYLKDNLSIHLQQFALDDRIWLNVLQARQMSDNASEDWESFWQRIFGLRNDLLRAIEVQRAAGLIKHSLEAELDLHLPQDLWEQMNLALQHGCAKQSMESFLKELLIVSQVNLQATEGDLQTQVKRAGGVKCPRCWKYSQSKHVHSLCPACEAIV